MRTTAMWHFNLQAFMTIAKCLLVLALALGLCALCAPAQMPTDNDAWRTRCDALHNALPSETTKAPANFLRAPGSTRGPQWTTFGWDRSRANQHAVACVFFYLGAIADANEPISTHATRTHASESWTLGVIEWKAAHGTSPTAAQRLTRDHAKLAEIPKSALTLQQEQSMVDTGRTLPLSSK